MYSDHFYINFEGEQMPHQMNLVKTTASKAKQQILKVQIGKK